VAGRADEGRELQDRVVADSERLLGKDHPATVAARKTRRLNSPAEGQDQPGRAAD
jgi:hypothetical protein